MKKIFRTSFHEYSAHVWLLIFRILASCFMLVHGLPKLIKLLEGRMEFSDPLGIGVGLSLALAAFSEAICSFLIILGLGTRLASIPLIFTMFVAAFVAHGDDPFAKKEKALLYLLIYITLLIFGGGKYSIDHILSKKYRR